MRDIEQMGGVAKAYMVDVSDYDAVNSAATAIRADLGTVDILVNNVRRPPSVVCVCGEFVMLLVCVPAAVRVRGRVLFASRLALFLASA